MKPSSDPALLERALKLAAEMLAEQAQLYDEVNTADEWVEELIARARTERSPQDSPVSNYAFA